MKLDLERELKEINEEIRYYPGPIVGCDAQFNWLLEERTGIAKQLKELLSPSYSEFIDYTREECPCNHCQLILEDRR